MTEPFGIEVKFNILHKTGKGVNTGMMKVIANAIEECAFIVLMDPENQFNREAQKCAAKLYRQVKRIREKADELEEEQ